MSRFSSLIKTVIISGLLVVAGTMMGSPKASASTKPVDASPSGIETQVHHKLAMLPWYGVFDYLQYQVNGTEVTLSGEVISEHETTRSDGENAVKRIPGVTKVINNIEVLPLSTIDNQIRRAEFRTIFSQSDLGRYTMGAIPAVHIIVKNGHVALDGVVMDQMDKTVAGLAANSVPGVFSVTNNLQIG